MNFPRGSKMWIPREMIKRVTHKFTLFFKESSSCSFEKMNLERGKFMLQTESVSRIFRILPPAINHAHNSPCIPSELFIKKIRKMSSRENPALKKSHSAWGPSKWNGIFYDVLIKTLRTFQLKKFSSNKKRSIFITKLKISMSISFESNRKKKSENLCVFQLNWKKKKKSRISHVVSVSIYRIFSFLPTLFISKTP